MGQMRIILSACVAVALLLSGCAKKSASDQALQSEIQGKLSSDALTKPAAVSVAVKDGVVTLGGDVPSNDVELQAMKIANGTTGVRTVNDQMKVNATMASSLPSSSVSPPSSSGRGQQPAPPAPTPATETAAASPAQGGGAPPPVAESAPPKPVPPATVTIAAGERLSVRMIDGIDSSKNTPGQTFRASLDAPLVVKDRVVAPVGSPVTVALTASQSAGRIKGSSELTVRVTQIEVRGRSYPVGTTDIAEQGKARGKQTAVRTGIGAAAGAIIGGLAGGGKGAAIGSAAGGGAGFGINALTHGPQVKIPSETVLNFQLQAPLTIRR